MDWLHELRILDLGIDTSWCPECDGLGLDAERASAEPLTRSHCFAKAPGVEESQRPEAAVIGPPITSSKSRD